MQTLLALAKAFCPNLRRREVDIQQDQENLLIEDDQVSIDRPYLP